MLKKPINILWCFVPNRRHFSLFALRHGFARTHYLRTQAKTYEHAFGTALRRGSLASSIPQLPWPDAHLPERLRAAEAPAVQHRHLQVQVREVGFHDLLGEDEATGGARVNCQAWQNFK